MKHVGDCFSKEENLQNQKISGGSTSIERRGSNEMIIDKSTFSMCVSKDNLNTQKF